MQTKNGKVKYVCSTKESDSDLEVLPSGMEFYEKASWVVGIRKKLVSKITKEEFKFVEKECKRLAAPNLGFFDGLWQNSAEKQKKSKDGIEKDRNCTYC